MQRKNPQCKPPTPHHQNDDGESHDQQHLSTAVLTLVAAEKKAAQEPLAFKRGLDLTNRLAISPAEFAQACGRHKVWAYRQIYRGHIRVLRDTGRLMIPMSEVRRFVSDPVIYDGQTPTAGKQSVKAD